MLGGFNCHLLSSLQGYPTTPILQRDLTFFFHRFPYSVPIQENWQVQITHRLVGPFFLLHCGLHWQVGGWKAQPPPLRQYVGV